MPILIKDYTWRQTEDIVIVRVPLHNIPHTKVDLFTSEIYIKVHYPPFLFECCLYDKINDEESKCTLVQGEVVFTLFKTEKKNWPELNKDVSKQEMIIIKKEAIDIALAKAADHEKHRKESRTKRQRACCSEQVALDSKIHTRIKELKDTVKVETVTDIQEWKNKETDQDFLPNPIRKANLKLKAVRELKSGKSERDGGDFRPETGGKDIFSDKEVVRDNSEFKKKKEVVDDAPPMRSTGTIGVNFTYRAFPTPGRESKLDEENEWLKKMAEARRKTGFVAEDLRPEENDPQWLLDKGKSFHEVGNFLGAISAFTHAIQSWTKIPELWVARSSSQLAVGNYRRVLRDTTEALSLLKPHVPSNADLRFASHLNRARALLEIGKSEGALADLEEALEIQPYREDVHSLIDRAEADVARHREEDARGASGKEEEYIQPEDLAN